jgi:YHS domain-containing protein
MKAILPALLVALCACQTPRVESVASQAKTTAIGRTELIDPALGTLGLAFLAEGRALGDAQALRAIEPIADRLVELNLARTSIGAGTLTRVSSLVALERLDLSFAALPPGSLQPLAGHPNLRELLLVGLELSPEDCAVLTRLPKLKEVYLHQARFDATLLPKLAGVTVLIDAPAPQPLETERAFTLSSDQKKADNANCPLTGAPVQAAFVVEFEGKRVGFCCATCRGKFLADPASYRSKLP